MLGEGLEYHITLDNGAAEGFKNHDGISTCTILHVSSRGSCGISSSYGGYFAKKMFFSSPISC